VGRLAHIDVYDRNWPRHLATLHRKIGDVLMAQGNLTDALILS
jgi:hypothetical protein